MVAFGVATDSLDAAGAVLERKAMPVGKDEVRRAMDRFLGDISQVPPMVSALKVGGRRLHQLAREGKEVEREPRPVHIGRFELEEFEPGPYPRATVLVECSSGTYIRSLAADLGAALGGAAHLGELCRLRVGPFTLDEAHPLSEIEADAASLTLSPAVAMRGLPSVTVSAETARAVAHGSVFPVGALEPKCADGVAGDAADPDAANPFAIIDEEGDLLAVYERRGAGLKPAVVVRPADGGAARERSHRARRRR